MNIKDNNINENKNPELENNIINIQAEENFVKKESIERKEINEINDVKDETKEENNISKNIIVEEMAEEKEEEKNEEK